MRKYLILTFASASLVSCWKFYKPAPAPSPGYSNSRVMGYKPIYGTETAAKTVLYSVSPQPVVTPGNIYAFQNYIFQLDPGRGIHVIDNTVPSAAHRIGFITVKGCSQISIKDDKLYTNCYDDLVVLEFSDLNNVHEFSRLKGVFTEYRYDSPLSQPPLSGYYECPRYDSFVVGWKLDSIYRACYKY